MDKIVTLKKKEEYRIAGGHLWAFSNEVQGVTGNPEAGDIVALHDHAGTMLGAGMYNPKSLIAVRLLSRSEVTVDVEFFRKRFESAMLLRQKLCPESLTYRLIHGEGDFLPGLIIDRYEGYFSVQTLSFGMDQRVGMICDALEALFHPQGIIERNESILRTHEGLEQKKGVLRGSADSPVIHENGLSFRVDLLEGQKTGFFLDQRVNRAAIRPFTKGARVLDCFCNDGGFAFNAAAAGARSVAGVDSSDSAIARSSENARLNGFGTSIEFSCHDAFDFLRQAGAAKEQFDLVILDPPSFARSKKTVAKAKRGYAELNSLAIRVLAPGGFLATASCSHHIYEETFLDIVNDAAIREGRSICRLEWKGASPDHPVLPAMPETQYLKFGIFRVV